MIIEKLCNTAFQGYNYNHDRGNTLKMYFIHTGLWNRDPKQLEIIYKLVRELTIPVPHYTIFHTKSVLSFHRSVKCVLYEKQAII